MWFSLVYPTHLTDGEPEVSQTFNTFPRWEAESSRDTTLNPALSQLRTQVLSALPSGSPDQQANTNGWLVWLI